MTAKNLIATMAMFFLMAGCCFANETLVFVRHGEKPQGGYGQLSCQGLNRALALPDVLIGKFGKPTYIFAPDPTEKVPDAAGKFFYVRPLATIEPTAIRMGLPAQTPFGVTGLNELQKALTDASMQNSVVFIAWEHIWLVKIVKSIVQSQGGDPNIVPEWTSDNDYDSIYVVTLSRDGNGQAKVGFKLEHEGLNDLGSSCPK